MSGISTHILDISLGRPAAGIQVTLERKPSDTAPWLHCATAHTDSDGRCKPLLAASDVLAGQHRLTFATAPYFAAQNLPTLYPEIIISFNVSADGASYHIPLLLSPFGYTTYRGT